MDKSLEQEEKELTELIIKLEEKEYIEWCKINSKSLYWALTHHRNTSRLEKMSFKDMPYLSSLYYLLDHSPRLCAEKSVQVGVSELFIIGSHKDASEGLTVMYVLPKIELRNRFVNNRIYKLHNRVDYYKNMVVHASGTHRISLMHFGRGTLNFVGSNSEDEFLEMPVDAYYVDEKDRCNLKNLILLPDRITASPYKLEREISNPTIEGFGIDERFIESTQRFWNIKCDHCGEYFTPDWFQHFVRETSPNTFVPRDENWEEGKELKLIHDCGKPVNRLKGDKSEWVPTYPGRDWEGVRISQLFSKYVKMEDLYKKWCNIQGNSSEIQVFYNSGLGLPFSSKDAKITDGALNGCKHSYEWPLHPGDHYQVLCAGIDVGKVLNLVIRELIIKGDNSIYKMVYLQRVPSFDVLKSILRAWNPRIVVIDSMPELHNVRSLKEEFNNVFSCSFLQDSLKLQINREERHVKIDRTVALDAVKQNVDLGNFIMPMLGESLDEGNYYRQMKASARIMEPNDKHPEKSRFVWAETQADHYFLTEAYCNIAFMLLPSYSGVFKFFNSELERMGSLNPIDSNSDLSPEKKEELKQLSVINSESFLNKIKKFT